MFTSQLFKLPCDEGRDMWILHCGGASFQANIENIKHIFICEQHFRSEDIAYKGSKANLLEIAIPLPYDSSFCRCSKYNIDILCRPSAIYKTRMMRKRNYIPTTQDYSSTIPDLSESYSPPSPELVVNRSENVKTYIRDYNIPLIPERNTPSPSQFLEPLKHKVPSHSLFCEQFNSEDIKCSNRSFPLEASTSKATNDNNYIKELLANKPKDVSAFLNAQLFHKFGRGQEWSFDEKDVFLKIYFKSPTCYKAMQSMGFLMPSIPTIMRWQSEITFSPGINESIINLLKYKCEKWNPLERRCILLFDEMAIKNELEYDSRQDVIYGLTDFGNGQRKDIVASSALLFMVRGLNLNWKQSIAYYIGAIDGKKLSEIILQVLEAINNVGLNVVGITCDQSPVNRKAYAKLGCTMKKPYIEYRNKNIALLHDPVHLIKSIRNCLLKADIECKGKKISWQIVEKIFREEENNTIKTCFKLTEKHIYPDSFDRMSVKLATQVLSRQVAIGIQLGIYLNIFPSDKIGTATYTAESFKKLNDLFDAFNSVTRFSANPQRCALSDDKNHQDVVETLKECRTWIQEWKHLGRMKRPYCFDGMIQTINGLFCIWENVKSSQAYIITSHLNPSALRLSRNLRQIAFQNLVPTISTSYNISTDETLLSQSSNLSLPEEEIAGFKEMFEDPQHKEIDHFVDEILTNNKDDECGEEDIINQSVILTVEASDDEEVVREETHISETSSLNSNAMVYFAGYVANNIINSYNCPVCRTFK